MCTKAYEPKKRRNADYKLVRIGDKFEPCEWPESSCGNIQFIIEPYELGDDFDKRFGSKSAPYVLARLCAMFDGLKIETCGQNAYKITWQLALRHKASGKCVTFYDYKSGISYGSDLDDHKKPPKDFIADVTKLLVALGNDRFPHPYDGCVVGEIA